MDLKDAIVPNADTAKHQLSFAKKILQSLRLRWMLAGLLLGAFVGSLIGNVGVAGRGGAVGVWTWLVCGLALAAVGYGVGLQHRLTKTNKSRS